MEINRLFCNHMILQAEKTVRIFGTGKGTVSVEINKVVSKTTSTADSWFLELPPQKYGGPYTLRVNLDGQIKEFSDVWFGDVYLMAGQSNMRYNIEVSPLEEQFYEENENMRIFGANEADAAGFYFSQGWCCLTKSNAGKWSAIAYYMGLTLNKKSDKKMGFILCGQGASVIQAYLPKGFFDNTDCYIPDEDRSGDFKNPLYSAWNGDGFLYKEKFSKIIPYNVKYVVWYQGEGNASGKDPYVYDKLLTSFIEKWRYDLMDDQLPFIIIQIANFKKWPRPECWKMIQEMQQKVCETVKNTYLVKSADVCEDDDIHPPTKKLLSERIANLVESLSDNL